MDIATADRTKPWMAVGAEIADLLPRVNDEEYQAIRAHFADRTRRWFFSGQGRSGLSAKMVAMRVMHMGRASHVIGEVTCPSVREGDGIVFFSGSGETAVTLAFARIALEERALVIAVTSNNQSTLAGLADLVLTIPVQTSAQLGGNLFEHTSLLVMDSLVNDFGVADHERPNETLRYWHTNMQ